jgi:predicted unusual protein kinase regulating ubiquinone biosynthesis (AarF/ABC1/UbiB family)
MRARFSEECDYGIEATWQRWMRETFAEERQIRIPEVIDPWTSRRVLTSRYIDGQNLDVFSRRASQADRDGAGETIWRFHYETIFRHGVFHLDPNPGNFLFAPDAVTFLDFGRVKRASASFHECWKRLLRAPLERDEDAAKQALVDIGYVTDASSFDFRPSLALVWSWAWPSLVDKPFHFTPEHIRRAWNAWAEDNTRANVDIHADMIFLPHVMLGRSGLLTTLRARVLCRDTIVGLLYPGGGAPPPYSDAELRRFGLPQSD